MIKVVLGALIVFLAGGCSAAKPVGLLNDMEIRETCRNDYRIYGSLYDEAKEDFEAKISADRQSKITYGQRVKVNAGFYKGLTGTVVRAGSMRISYYLKLDKPVYEKDDFQTYTNYMWFDGSLLE